MYIEVKRPTALKNALSPTIGKNGKQVHKGIYEIERVRNPYNRKFDDWYMIVSDNGTRVGASVRYIKSLQEWPESQRSIVLKKGKPPA